MIKRYLAPFGNIYVQGSTVGLASYHFESADKCYISYENPLPHWLNSEGNLPVEKKYFQNVEYDENFRQFKGEISWTLGQVKHRIKNSVSTSFLLEKI